jgi:segregation and condensation protein A
LVDGPSNLYLPELEGVKAPLGVLLYLIRRDNLDIYDIPISRITKEYLEYLELMEELQIELAGEFFVMAATLMRIKAQMLLRRDDTEEDPREGLVRSLLEYKKMVEAARSLKEMEEERLKIFTRPVPDREKEFVEEPTLELNLFHLMKAFRKIVNEFEAREVSEIDPEEYTIEEKVEVILAALATQEMVSFQDLFSGISSRLEAIVTFMALLELIKLARIRVRQESPFGAIWIYRAAQYDSEEHIALSQPDSPPAEQTAEKDNEEATDAG